ncbi:MAG TPA: hypothetical protein VIM56_03785 [Rhizomicrobium sp.]
MQRHIPSSSQAAVPAKAKKARLWDRGPDDWYVEEDWCNRALFASPIFKTILAKIIGRVGPNLIIVDPFCGRGRVLDAAADAGYRVFGFDKVDRGASKRHPFAIADFNSLNILATIKDPFIIVGNPPYNGGIPAAQADPAACRALMRRAVEDMGAAAVFLLLRSKWANADKNSRLLEKLPIKYELKFSPRPSMPTGEFVLAAERGDKDPRTDKPCKVGGGQEDFSYYAFDPQHQTEPMFGWLRKSSVVSTSRERSDR